LVQVDAEVTGRKFVDYIEGFEEFCNFVDRWESHAEYLIWELLFFRTYPNQPFGPPSLLYNGHQVSFLGVKQPGLGVDHPPPSSAEVKERVELYLYYPSGPSWPVLGGIFLFCISN
jgi:hypothetical protein